MLPTKKFKVLYADPLFDYRGRNVSKRKGLPVDSFSALKETDINSIAEKDSTLLLWTEGAYFDKALELIDAWGFKYNRVSFILHDPNNIRKSPRLCLLATKGKPKATKLNRLCQVLSYEYISEIGVGDIIKSYLPKTSAIKLFFESSKVKGWGAWGTWGE